MTYTLPETEEDDQFNRQQLQDRLVLTNVTSYLKVELEDTVHGDCDTNRVENLHPDMAKGRVQAGVAVPPSCLRDERDECKEDANETVLEYAYPHDVEPCQAT